MKRLLLFLFLVCFTSLSFSQQQYTVEGQTYTLLTEVEGPLTLLWNTIDEEYRFFAKKGDNIVELKNTKVNGDYQEEYKQTLADLTSDGAVATDRLKLTKGSLRDFFNTYNKQKDPNYEVKDTSIKLSTRIGPYLGVSNAIFTSNPTNETLFTAGADFEITDEVLLRRHSVVLRFKQTFSNDEYDFSSSQLSLNYRFKFIKSSLIDVFVNTKFVAYTYVDRTFTTRATGPADEPIFITEEESGGDFNAPAAFGLGADIALGNGYLFVTYNDLVAIGVDSNEEFPIDFSVGYKFNL